MEMTLMSSKFTMRCSCRDEMMSGQTVEERGTYDDRVHVDGACAIALLEEGIARRAIVKALSTGKHTLRAVHVRSSRLNSTVVRSKRSVDFPTSGKS